MFSELLKQMQTATWRWGRDDWKVTPGRFSDHPPQGVTLQVGALAQVWGKISWAYARMCAQVGLYVGRMYPPRVFTPPPAGAPAGGKLPLAACQLPFYSQLPSYAQLFSCRLLSFYSRGRSAAAVLLTAMCALAGLRL